MKFLRGLVLLPMWPLIWYQEGKDSHNSYSCGCGTGKSCSGCSRRARKMRNWYEGR